MKNHRHNAAARARWTGVLLAMSVLLLIVFPLPGHAARVVILVADRCERADVWDASEPNLARLCREATVGLMNTRFVNMDLSKSSNLPESACMALGAGSFVQYEGSQRWRGGGTAADAAAFRVDAGRALPPGALYCRECERLRLYSNPGAHPGALGTALRAAGKRTACIGNADMPGMPRRYILSLLMDGRGMVDGGDVGAAMTEANSLAPGGVRANLPAMLQAFDREAPRADVVAVDFGDTARLAYARPTLSAAAYRRARRTARQRLDRLVGALRARIDPEQTLFILLSPAPPIAPSFKEQVLTPVFFVGRGWGPGLLLSATTRRPGLIANADVTATIAALFGLGPLPDGAGLPLEALSTTATGARLRALDADVQRVVRWRFSVIPAWGLVLALAMFIWPLFLLRRQGRGRCAAWGHAVQLAGLSLPAGTFLASGLAPQTLGKYILQLGAATALIAVGAAMLGRWRRALPAPFWVAAFTVIAFLADAACGAPHLGKMMVSYALTEGARYYGLGNELMGVTIALALVGLLSLLPGCGRRGIAAAWLLALFLSLGIGASAAGANFGGGLTAAVTFSVAAALLSGWHGWRAVLAPMFFTVILGAGLVALDLCHGAAAMSHVGRAVGAMHAEGASWTSMVLARKIGLNSLLMRRIGAPVLGAMALLALAGLRLPRTGRILSPEQRQLLAATVAGGVAALLLNDSGVIACGLMLVFVTIGVGYLALNEEKE